MTETKLNIVYLPVAEIHPYSANPRKHGRESIDAIKQSIEQFGFKVPLQVDKDHVIVNGHGRLLAAKELGFTELPCIVCDDLEAQKIRAFRISDNQVQAVSEWDMDTLQNELLELQKEDYDLNLLGFGEKLNMYLGGTDADRPNEGETNADDVPDINEDNEQAFSKRGEIYQLGNHRLVCGDSTDALTIDKLLEGDTEKPSVWLTDPPYNVGYDGGSKLREDIANDKMESTDFLDFLTTAFKNVVPRLCAGCSCYMFFPMWEVCNFVKALENNGLKVREYLIWVKNQPMLSWSNYLWKHEPILYFWTEGAGPKWYSDRKQTTVLEFSRPTRSDLHPTQKNIDMLEYMLGNSSKRGDIVIDTFGGSGSTLMACERLDRVCRMVELQPSYADVIRRRWAEFVHGKDCDWQSLTPVVGHLEDGKGA